MNETLIKACDLYARTSRGPGNREYWVGYLGGLKVLVFRVNNPAEDGPAYTLHLAPRPPRQDQPRQHQPQQDRDDPPARERPPEAWTNQDRERHAEKLAAEFTPDSEPF